MNDNDPRNLPEWLQRDADESRAETAGERLWIGLGLMILVAAAVIGLNAWLGTVGYGA